MKAKRLSPEGEEQVVVISVSQHKTGVEWTAKLMLSNLDYTCLREYMVCIWPNQDGERTLENMLVLCGPRSLANLNQHVQALGKYYNLVLPTPTRIRKIGATTVTLNVGSWGDRDCVTRQLSHSISSVVNLKRCLVDFSSGPASLGSSSLTSVGFPSSLASPWW